jgi:hypothetical protein
VAAPLDALQRAPDQDRRERLRDHDAEDSRIARARRGDALADDGRAQAGFDMDEIRQLRHRSEGVWHSVAQKFKLVVCRCRC